MSLSMCKFTNTVCNKLTMVCICPCHNYVEYNILYISLYRSIAHLKSAWRSYRIAVDLTNESWEFPIHNKDVHIPAFETFLVTVNLFDRILNGLKQMKNGEIDKIRFKDDHWTEYHTVRAKFTNFVSSAPFNYHEVQYLKASFFVFFYYKLCILMIIFYSMLSSYYIYRISGLSPIRSN